MKTRNPKISSNKQDNKYTIGKLRIIGGMWRSRIVTFKNYNTLRPTPDRVRETLFNWLAPTIVDAKCLDLFAGSGILGLEAISRGAKSVIAVDKNRDTVAIIKQNQEKLATNSLDLIHADVLTFLSGCTNKFDVIFIDPPYSSSQLLQDCIRVITTKKLLTINGLLYFESNVELPADIINPLNLLKKKKAGKIYYYLAQLN